MTSHLAIELAINLPDPPAVAGLHVRPFDIGRDIEQLVDLICDANLADQTAYTPSVAQFRNDLEHHAYFDPARDMLVAEVDGRLVAGTRHEIRVRASFVQHQIDGWVQPDLRRRGVGRAFLRWTERRAREAAAEWAGPEPHRLGSWVDETQPGAIALLESEGYERVRYGFMMVRPLSEPIPEAPRRPDSRSGRSRRSITAESGTPTRRPFAITRTRRYGPRRTSSAGSRRRESIRRCGGSPGRATRSRARS